METTQADRSDGKTKAFRKGAPILSIKDVSVVFGGIKALQDVSFDIHAGEIFGLIGPNGAGKTTLFNCLSRLYQPSSGDIRMCGQSILNLRPHQIAETGLGRTFQNVALFQNLTVADNVRIGGHWRSGGTLLTDGLGISRSGRDGANIESEIYNVLKSLDLLEVKDIKAMDLPFGTQKRVELARALMSKPSLLLLDEPAGGLNHEEVYALGDVITRIRDEWNVTILLVEHHMGLVMSIADYVVTLNFGKKLAEGTPTEVQSHEEVIRAYLGGPAK